MPSWRGQKKNFGHAITNCRQYWSGCQKVTLRIPDGLPVRLCKACRGSRQFIQANSGEVSWNRPRFPYVISGFHRSVNEVFGLLGYCAMSIGSYRCFGEAYRTGLLDPCWWDRQDVPKHRKLLISAAKYPRRAKDLATALLSKRSLHLTTDSMQSVTNKLSLNYPRICRFSQKVASQALDLQPSLTTFFRTDHEDISSRF